MRFFAIVSAATWMFLAQPSLAAEACANQVAVKVNGLVCDFCARTLEKVFSKREEVSGITVDLDKGDVLVTLKSGQTLADDIVTQLITDAGYNVTSLKQGC